MGGGGDRCRAVAVAVLLAVRLTQALGVKNTLNKVPIPTVSVTEFGMSSVPTTVSIIGTIAARYDTPIGVEAMRDASPRSMSRPATM